MRSNSILIPSLSNTQEATSSLSYCILPTYSSYSYTYLSSQPYSCINKKSYKLIKISNSNKNLSNYISNSNTSSNNNNNKQAFQNIQVQCL